MKKIFVFLVILCYSFKTYSQDISYGLNLGINGYDINGKDDILSADGFSFFNIGAYIDLKISDKIGIRGNVLLSHEREDFYGIYRTSPRGFQDIEEIFDKSKLTNLHLYPLLKFDVDASYHKGFYLLAGPRITFILNSEIEGAQGINNEEFYRATNAGLMLGFGSAFLKHFGFELIGDYLITNKINFEDQRITNLGAFFNFTINLESILNN